MALQHTLIVLILFVAVPIAMYICIITAANFEVKYSVMHTAQLNKICSYICSRSYMH